jgi:hypothetical protein
MNSKLSISIISYRFIKSLKHNDIKEGINSEIKINVK